MDRFDQHKSSYYSTAQALYGTTSDPCRSFDLGQTQGDGECGWHSAAAVCPEFNMDWKQLKTAVRTERALLCQTRNGGHFNLFSDNQDMDHIDLWILEAMIGRPIIIHETDMTEKKLTLRDMPGEPARFLWSPVWNGIKGPCIRGLVDGMIQAQSYHIGGVAKPMLTEDLPNDHFSALLPVKFPEGPIQIDWSNVHQPAHDPGERMSTALLSSQIELLNAFSSDAQQKDTRNGRQKRQLDESSGTNERCTKHDQARTSELAGQPAHCTERVDGSSAPAEDAFRMEQSAELEYYNKAQLERRKNEEWHTVQPRRDRKKSRQLSPSLVDEHLSLIPGSGIQSRQHRSGKACNHVSTCAHVCIHT